MFRDCTSLTTAPELPATTLAPYCYANMFDKCTSLTSAQAILPATTIKSTRRTCTRTTEKQYVATTVVV